MKTITIDKTEFLKGFSLSKYYPSGGFAPESLGFEVDRQIGVLRPNRVATEYSTNVTDSGVASCYYNPLGSYFTIGNQGKIYQTDAASRVHTVKHTESNKIYDTNSSIYIFGGKLYITSTTDIYRDDLTFTVNDYRWWTNTLTKAPLTANVPHKLFEFQNKLYITDGNKIHETDGSTGTFGKLTLPTGWVITDAFADNDVIYITASFGGSTLFYNSPSRIFVWNGISPLWTREVDPKLSSINAITKTEKTYILFANNDMYLFDGYNVKWRAKVNKTPNFNQISTNGNKIFFVGDQGVMSYNARFDCLTQPYYDNKSINVLMNSRFDYLQMWTSSNKFYEAYSSSGVSTFYSNIYDLDNSNIRKVEILFETPLVTGNKYNFYIYNEKGDTTFTKEISYTLDKGILKKTFSVNKFVSLSQFAIAFSLTGNQSIIYIKIYYEQSERNTSK
ncbi:MAG: hypothetical protein HY959_03695 [Ignavibacteriae bacterium]|nr:hypothetical protein [Ignavibacteriota bacterium]